MLHDPKREAQIAEEIFHASLEPWQRLLLQSAETFKEHGWGRGSLVRQGKFCSIGAIYYHTGVINITGTAIDRNIPRLALEAEQHVQEYLQHDVMSWNDFVVEDAATVIRTFQFVALG